MYLIMILIIFLISLVLLMMSLNFLIMKKLKFNREKVTPFECGFNPITSARLPFSINFYLVMMIFLIFDVEIILLLPMIFSMMFLTNFWIYLFIYIMLILIIGIYMEWVENSIYWIF